jgi:hypothetical protein
MEAVEEKLKLVRKRLAKENRFDKVLERFKSIRNYLKYLGVLEEDSNGANGTLTFDFGLVLENQLSYYAGLIFKLVTTTSNSAFI